MSTNNASLIGALPPPPGVTPNFQDPPSIAPSLIKLNIFLVVLVSLVTWIRLYTRIWVAKLMTLADWSTVLAYCTFLVYFSVLDKALHTGAAGKHQWNVPITLIPEGLYWVWLAEIIYSICIGTVRLAVCLRFVQIFVVGRTKRFWVLAVFIAINMGFYSSMVFVVAFQCNPVSKFWNGKLEGTCMFVPVLRTFTVVGSFNLFGDLFMLAYPLYFIWGLHACRRRRLALGALFMVGLLGIVAAVFRLVYSIFYTERNLDQTLTITQVGECTFAEICAGMLVASLISFPTFFTFVKDKYKGWRTRASQDRHARISGSDSNNSTFKGVPPTVQLDRMNSVQESEQSRASGEYLSGDVQE